MKKSQTDRNMQGFTRAPCGPYPPHPPPPPPLQPFHLERGLGFVCFSGSNDVIQEPGVVPRDAERAGARLVASKCRAPECAGLGSPRGSPRWGAWTRGHRVWRGWMQGHQQRLLQTQHRLPPRVTAASGRGLAGRFYWQGPEGRRPASLLTGRAGLSSWWPRELARRSTPWLSR